VRRFYHDYETASLIDLKKRGLDVYARDKSTRVLMLGYAFDDEPAKLWVPEDEFEPLPAEVEDALEDERIRKIAFNAPFERAITDHVLDIATEPDAWECVMAMGLSLALPGNLAQLGDAVGLPEDKKKLSDGKRLIRKFCVPRKPTKNKPWMFNTAETDPEDWERFCHYCTLDVESERAIYKRIARYRHPTFERRIWILDQKINERGLPIDMKMVNGAVNLTKHYSDALTKELTSVTKLGNPNSPSQLLPWLQKRGYPFSDLKKDRVKLARREHKDLMTEDARQAIDLRLRVARSSLKKYPTVLRATADDHRLRYVFQYAGAGRTGRWAGRLVQPQNLARPAKEVKPWLEDARKAIREADIETIELMFSEPMDVLTSSIRSSIIAPNGKKLRVSDLSAIESRGIAWASNCESMLDVFRKGLDPYISFACHLYEEDYDNLWHEYKVLKNGEKRTNSKPAVLGAGYRLGGGDLVGEYPDIKRTGLWGYAESMGIEMSREEAHRAVTIFREAYPEVVQTWYDLENAAKDVATEGGRATVNHFRFERDGPFLLLRLPSGRCLYYCRPRVQPKTRVYADGTKSRKWGLTYEGVHQTSKKWVRMDTHGGKLVENIVQALARDILVEGMLRADDDGFTIIGHVHDEIITLEDADDAYHSYERLEELMSVRSEWAPDLPLGAEGYEADFYKKD